MIESILYIILALFGIGFLIFIHELGHYFMARKVGIIVEVFSIGFGKSLYEWERDGVKWKISWLPFGGYVKMAGMEKKGSQEPSKVEHGYFGSKPFDRIKVAFMGPLVNIVFALLGFSFLWIIGGREKPFAEFTQYIGYVAKDSNPYKEGIRPGDQIKTLNDRSFKGFNDFLYGAALDNRTLTMSGSEINYLTSKKTPFTYSFPLDENLEGIEKAKQVLQVLSPAQYLFFEKMPKNSPMRDSGIGEGDRILWVDGKLIFSYNQLVETLNDAKVLLTIERDKEIFITRVPRVRISDLRLSFAEKEEFDDWRYEARLASKVGELSFIPYNLSAGAVVEEPLSYIDERSQVKMGFEVPMRASVEIPLMPGDRILAVQGKEIRSSYELLSELQTLKTLIIVKKVGEEKPLLWTDANQGFVSSFPIDDLEKIVQSIGTNNPLTQSGALTMLNPVIPIPLQEFPRTPELPEGAEEKIAKYQKTVDEISDPKEREQAENFLQSYQNRKMLGVMLKDKAVIYNPNPFAVFLDVMKESYRTLYALITGHISPKHMAGPVGMVEVVHYSWSIGAKETLYWLGMISLNLGLLNLLPLPILDGGHICLAIVEMFTKKPLKAKTMERLIIPFMILLVILLVYITYNDIARIIGRLF